MDWDALIARAVAEDLGTGDITSEATVSASLPGRAEIQAKAVGVLAGTEVATRIFRFVHPDLHVVCHVQDGAPVAPGMRLATITGPVAALLAGERTALNVLQRMSGIATQTNEYVRLLDGLQTKILDTRKTTPGMRIFEKMAVKIGGGENHRMGLYDMVMIKDNHIDYAGGIRPAIEGVKSYLKQIGKDLKIEVEARCFSEIDEIMEVGGIHRIMIDNFTVEDTKKAVEMIGGTYETEASGGITKELLRAYASCGVDYISVGALTHQIFSLDLSLKAVK